MPPPPNPFRMDPPTGVRPVYDSLRAEHSPFQPSTQTPEELLPDMEAVWRAGGELKPEQIRGFMNAITTANLRADPTYYGDGPKQWQKPTTSSCEIWPVNAPPTNAESRTVKVALDGHTLSFRFWRDIHLPHIGRSALYYFSHECLDDSTFAYDVYR